MGDEERLWSEATSLMASGDYENAAKKFGDYSKLKSEKLGPYLMRGQAYLKLKRLDDAIKDLSKVLELDPDHTHARYLRGQAYSLRGESEKAVEDYRVTLEKIPLRPGSSPNRYSVHLDQGTELFKLGRYKEAETHLMEVLTASPSNETAQTMMRQIRQKTSSG